MFRSLVRTTIGFVLSNLVAGIILTLCVFPPREILLKTNQFKNILELIFMTAIQCGLFTLPLAGPLLVVCEWLSLRSLMIYIFIGMVLAMGSYFLYFSDQTAVVPLLQNTAFVSLIMSGIFSGLVYWTASGRKAGTGQK